MEKRKPKRRMAHANQGATPKRRKQCALVSVALVGALTIGGTIAFLVNRTGSLENTFKPAEVACAVVETFDQGVKSDVVIQNTGNVNAYIRAAVVVNWVDADGNVLPETPSAKADENDLEYDYVVIYDRDGEGGTVDTKWVQHDKYWYYTAPVPENGQTENLILSCTVSESAPAGRHLSVDIIASAIQAEPAAAVGEAWGVSISDNSVAAYAAGA